MFVNYDNCVFFLNDILFYILLKINDNNKLESIFSLDILLLQTRTTTIPDIRVMPTKSDLSFLLIENQKLQMVPLFKDVYFFKFRLKSNIEQLVTHYSHIGIDSFIFHRNSCNIIYSENVYKFSNVLRYKDMSIFLYQDLYLFI